MEQFLNPATIDPNIIYLALLFGLWAGVTAFYIPGTGIVEIVSLVVLGGVLVAMTSLPTSWVAVLLMVIGVTAFLVLPFVKPDWAQYADAGLILQAAGGYFLFEPGQISLVLIAMTIAMAWAYNHYLLVPMLRSHNTDVSLDDDNIVGMTGRVVKSIGEHSDTDTGTVHVKGELWTARSRDPLESGTEIVVVNKRGLELEVEKAKRDEFEHVI